MPTYLFHDTNTGKKWEEWMRITEADEYLKNNPHICRLVNGAPMIVTNVGSAPKVDNAFKNKLRAIKKANPRSKINDWGLGEI